MKKVLFSLLEKTVKFIMAGMSVDTRRIFCMHLTATPNFIKTIPSSYGEIQFYCPSELTAWRASTLLTKEPETIAWIDTMPQGAVLWDIGANVGCYTIYAAKRGLEVLAFEPACTNYGTLNTNIALNSLSGRATAYCLAVSELPGLGLMQLSSLEVGGALSGFHGKTQAARSSHHGQASVFTQGMMGWSVDGLVRMPGTPFPNYIKIDVDGIELEIIKGAGETLCDPRLHGLMVEVEEDDAETSAAIVSRIESAGMVLEGRRHGAMLEDGPFATVYNYFFVRKTS